MVYYDVDDMAYVLLIIWRDVLLMIRHVVRRLVYVAEWAVFLHRPSFCLAPVALASTRKKLNLNAGCVGCGGAKNSDSTIDTISDVWNLARWECGASELNRLRAEEKIGVFVDGMNDHLVLAEEHDGKPGVLKLNETVGIAPEIGFVEQAG